MINNPILIIAKNLIKESVRERIYSISIIVALVLFGLSLIFGSMSFGEESRVLAHFGWLGILLSGLAMSVFIASPFFQKEISKQNLLVTLARPITRAQYYLGSWLGLTSIMFLGNLGLSVFLYILLPSDVPALSFSFIVLGIFFEQLIVLSVGMLFGLFFKPTLAGTLTISIYLMGHWQQDLKFFIKGTDNPLLQSISFLIEWGVPALHEMNFRSIYFLTNPVSQSQITWISIHTLAWVVLINTLGVILFKRRDLV